MAVLHPLECYLLETFSSPEHFAATRDAVIEWIDARVQTQLDPQQCNKPQWQQGDVVWGNCVLPNIRPDRAFYIKAYIQRIDSDPLAFKAGYAMRENNRGIREFWGGWMTEEEQQRISLTGDRATKLDDRLGNTTGGWGERDLTYNGQGSLYQVSELPRRIPRYVLDPSVHIEKDERPKQIGIYLPDVDFAGAHLLYPTEWTEGGKKVWRGVRRSTWVHPDTGKRAYDWKESQWVETGWTLIRRVPGEFIDVPEQGFFPKGQPDELYTWPEREAQFISRDGACITALSGEPE
ncbi:hypothetical protein [Pseudomonas sp. MWU13-2100]|uniref:hypothetical protein n=1 Tax=Pseudomonas sp. MWU13-2100 TaxID=2935075 RepID=UPI00200EB1F5|nr:hypothetical protein [Pseudomonas sp. MWU13-2100]